MKKLLALVLAVLPSTAALAGPFDVAFDGETLTFSRRRHADRSLPV
jgi:hypothetical protein